VWKALFELYPDAECELDFENNFQLLVAVVLSAQTTDKGVNKVTPLLFEKYPDAKSLANAKQSDIENILKSIGLYKNKSKNVIALAHILDQTTNGKVPEDRELLESLPGVGRKTANVVLSNGFNYPALAVDTHVNRLSKRLGLSKESDPLKVEQDLLKLFNRDQWCMLSHMIIWHGRRVCKAQRPDCPGCTLQDICPEFKS